MHDFFVLCRRELAGPAQAEANAYLVAERGIPEKSLHQTGLGIIPPTRRSIEKLRDL